MTSQSDNQTIVRQFMEQAFNQGDLTAVDRHLTPDAIDYQEPPGTDFVNHLKQVIPALRTAFPDLHFEIHDMLSEGDLVAFRSTMTGTHLGPFSMGPVRDFAPTARSINVAHMHFVRINEGKGGELWHLWDMPGLMRQLGITPEPQRS
jgi:predicted ester cyclase